MNFLITLLGWVGTGAVILAYLLLSSEKIKSNSNTYEYLNLAGALMIGVQMFYSQVWSSLALQVVWGIIAVISILKKN
jgi:ABC-type multidrug transport system permease subunit